MRSGSEIIRQLAESLEDPISLALFTDPCFLSCGHTLDERSYSMSNKHCPTCNLPQQRVNVDHKVNELCDILTSNISAALLEEIIEANGSNAEINVDEAVIDVILKQLKQALICPISQKIMTDAVTVSCGHSFSQEVIDDALTKPNGFVCSHCNCNEKAHRYLNICVRNVAKAYEKIIAEELAASSESSQHALPKNERKKLEQAILQDKYDYVLGYFNDHPDQLEAELFGPRQTLFHFIISEGKVGLLIMMADMRGKFETFITKYNFELLKLVVNSPKATPDLLAELPNFGFDFAAASENDTVLTLAIKKQRWDLVEVLINANKDLNINFKSIPDYADGIQRSKNLKKDDHVYDYEATALLLAVAHDCPVDTFLRLLTVQDIDVNAHNHDGVFPLYLAARRGNLEKVLLLQAVGCDQEKRCADRTAYQEAAAQQHGKVVQALTTRKMICTRIQERISENNMNEAAFFAIDLYHLEGASFGEFANIISEEFGIHREQLMLCFIEQMGIRQLQKAADFPALADFLRGLFESDSLSFDKIILQAIKEGCSKFIGYLVARNVIDPKLFNQQRVPVIHAALVDNPDNSNMVEFLIKQGFDPGIHDNRTQQTPLMRAVLSIRREKYVELLVAAAKTGADIKVNRHDDNNLPAVTQAAQIGIEDATFEQLLSIPDVDLVVAADSTNPLIQTIILGNGVRAMRLLRERGVSSFVLKNAKMLRKIANDNGVAAQLKGFFETAPFVLARKVNEALAANNISYCVGALMEYSELANADEFFAVVTELFKSAPRATTEGIFADVAVNFYNKKMFASLHELFSNFDVKSMLALLVGRRAAIDLILWMLKEKLIPLEMPIVDGRTLFLLAVEKGNFNLVERMISGNDSVPVNIHATVTQAAQSAATKRSVEGYTALMLAARSPDCSLASFEKLLALPGMNVGAVNDKGESALVIAASVGANNKVLTLLYHPDPTDVISRTQQIKLAQRAGDPHPGMKYIFEDYDRINACLEKSNTTTATGEEYFQAAAAELSKVPVLVEKQLQLICQYLRRTYPAKAGDFDRYLLVALAKEPPQNRDFILQLANHLSDDINIPFLNGETILHIACRDGNLDFVMHLLQASQRLDVNAKINNDAHPDYLATPLLLAIKYSPNPYPICQALMKVKDLSLAADHRGITPLIAALSRYHVSENLTELFLKFAKSSPQLTLNEQQQVSAGQHPAPFVAGDTALIMATRMNVRPPLYSELLALPNIEKGAVNAHGETALDIAVKLHEDSVKRFGYSQHYLWELSQGFAAQYIKLLTNAVSDKIRLMKIYLARKNFQRVADIVNDIYVYERHPIFDHLNREPELYRDVARFLMQQLGSLLIQGRDYTHIVSLIRMNPALVDARIAGVPLMEAAMNTDSLEFITLLLRVPGVTFPPENYNDQKLVKRLPENARAVLICYRFMEMLMKKPVKFEKQEFENFVSFYHQSGPDSTFGMLKAIYEYMSASFERSIADVGTRNKAFDNLSRVFICLKVLLGDAEAIADQKHERHPTNDSEISDFYDFANLLHNISKLAGLSKLSEVRKWKQKAVDCAYDMLKGLLAGLHDNLQGQQILLINAISMPIFQPKGLLFQNPNYSNVIKAALDTVNQRIKAQKEAGDVEAIVDDFVPLGSSSAPK